MFEKTFCYGKKPGKEKNLVKYSGINIMKDDNDYIGEM